MPISLPSVYQVSTINLLCHLIVSGKYEDNFLKTVINNLISSEISSPLSLARSARNTKEIFYHRQDFCENTKCSLHDLYLSIEVRNSSLYKRINEERALPGFHPKVFVFITASSRIILNSLIHLFSIWRLIQKPVWLGKKHTLPLSK